MSFSVLCSNNNFETILLTIYYHQNLSAVLVLDANFFYHLKTNLIVISNLSGRVLLANLSPNILNRNSTDLCFNTEDLDNTRFEGK